MLEPHKKPAFLRNVELLLLSGRVKGRGKTFLLALCFNIFFRWLLISDLISAPLALIHTEEVRIFALICSGLTCVGSLVLGVFMVVCLCYFLPLSLPSKGTFFLSFGPYWFIFQRFYISWLLLPSGWRTLRKWMHMDQISRHHQKASLCLSLHLFRTQEGWGLEQWH